MGVFKKKPKPVALKGKSSFEKRKLIGVLLIVAALVLTFIVIPMMNKATNSTEVIAVAKTDIQDGSIITEKDISFAERGVFGMDGYITKKEDIIGKQAAADILKNDIVTKNKIGKENISKIQEIVNGQKALTTISVKTNAAGLASHLKAGDYVRIYNAVAGEYSDSSVIMQNPLLEKIEVYSIENSNTEPVEENLKQETAGSSEMVAATITFVTVSKEQETALLEAEYNGSIHVVFVER